MTLLPVGQRPWSHDIPEGPWDYVVIGSGMGGMVSAALLSKLGKRVLILESHSKPGGFTHMFKRPGGYRWDVGVHIIGEMSERSYPGRLLNELTDGRLGWEPVGDIYDEFHFPDGFAIQFPNSFQGFRDALYEAFPDERDGIDAYLQATRAAARSSAKALQARALPSVVPGMGKKAEAEGQRWFQRTTADVLAEVTDDPRLRAVLAAQWGYYGDTPRHSSFGMHALMAQHFMGGAYFPVGGSTSIAEELLATVEDAGGWCSVRRTVEEIVTRRGTAVGVRLADGTEIGAKRVISAVGAATTARLLGEDLAGSDTGYRRQGPAHLSLYLGFKGDIESAGATRQCQWFYDTWDIETPMWEIAPDKPLGQAAVLFNSWPSLKDPRHDPGEEQLHTGEVITFVPYDSFARWDGTKRNQRGEGYEEWKQEIADTLLEQYLGHYPGLRPMVEIAELSTPVSTTFYARSERGSIYGLGTEPARFADTSLRPKTRVKGLYLGGVDAALPGVVGAMTGGVLAALAAEPVKGLRFVQPLMQRPKP